MIVSALEEVLLEMSSKVEKVESDVRTNERHPLDELESLKTSVSTLQNSEVLNPCTHWRES